MMSQTKKRGTICSAVVFNIQICCIIKIFNTKNYTNLEFEVKSMSFHIFCQDHQFFVMSTFLRDFRHFESSKKLVDALYDINELLNRAWI